MDCANTKRTCEGVMLRFGKASHDVCLFENFSSMLDHGFTHGRDVDATIRSLKKHHAQLLFKLIDLP